MPVARHEEEVREPKNDSATPVAPTRDLPLTFKTNKSLNGKSARCSFVIPCFLIHVDGLLWSHFFSHSNEHGRPAACVARESAGKHFREISF